MATAAIWAAFWMNSITAASQTNVWAIWSPKAQKTERNTITFFPSIQNLFFANCVMYGRMNPIAGAMIVKISMSYILNDKNTIFCRFYSAISFLHCLESALRLFLRYTPSYNLFKTFVHLIDSTISESIGQLKTQIIITKAGGQQFVKYYTAYCWRIYCMQLLLLKLLLTTIMQLCRQWFSSRRLNMIL